MAETTFDGQSTNTEHKWFEDVIALILGTALVSFGVVLLKQVGMVTGGVAGLALFLHYKFDVSFGLLFFLLNLPFYWLAISRIGWQFTIKTFIAVAMVSYITNAQDLLIHIDQLDPIYGSLLASFFFGTGFIVIFRHKASLGGMGILSLYIQDKTGLRAGWTLMAADVLIIAISASIVSPLLLILSIGCVLVLNLIIALNHRKDRYSV